MLESIANQYLSLQTALLLPFLVMMLLIQTQRADETWHPIGRVRSQVVMVFGLFAVLALGFGSMLYTLSPLLAVELAAGFTLALIHPVNALCFFVMVLFLRPWDVMPNNALFVALPRLLAATCLLSWLLHPWKHAKPGIRTKHSLVLLLAFSTWLFISTFVTPNVSYSQTIWFETYFKCLIVFLMCSFFIENKRSVTEFKYTILISIFAMVVLGLYQFLMTPRLPGQHRLSALSFFDPNDLAAVSVIAIPLALAVVFSKTGSILQRITGVLFFGVSLIAIWYSQSRGALLALVAQLVAFQIIQNLSRRRVAVAVSMIAVAAGVYMFVMGNLSHSRNDLAASSESRMTYWKAATRMTLQNPILGVGFEQFPYNYERYSPSLKYEWGLRAAHSSWLVAFAESGLLGGFLFVIFFITVLKTAWRNRHENPDQLYALGGYGVAMSFLTHTYLLFPYLLYGLIMANDSVKDPISHAR